MTGAAFFEIGIIFAGCQATGMNVGYRGEHFGQPYVGFRCTSEVRCAPMLIFNFDGRLAATVTGSRLKTVIGPQAKVNQLRTSPDISVRIKPVGEAGKCYIDILFSFALMSPRRLSINARK